MDYINNVQSLADGTKTLTDVISDLGPDGINKLLNPKQQTACHGILDKKVSTIDSIHRAATPFLDEREESVKQSGEYFSVVEQYGRLYLLKTIQDWGFCRKSGSQFTITSMMNELKIGPGFIRLIHALFDILERQAYIIVDKETVKCLDKVSDSETRQQINNLKKFKNDVLQRFSDMSSFFELIETCMNRYLEIMQGEVTATEIMFPMFSMDLVGKIFKGSRMADHFNQLTALSVYTACKEMITTKYSEKPVRILEIGAGTGGTSDSVLDSLSALSDHVEYLFTDLSKGFVRMGQKRLKEDYPFTKFKVLDIESGAGKPGFEKGSFDVIFASNVIHATRLIGKSLQGVKQLLKPGGLFMMIEVTNIQDFATLTFGLLDGWWHFEDIEKRIPHSPLLPKEGWIDELTTAGLDHVGTLSSSHVDKEDSFSQSLFIADNPLVAARYVTVLDIITSVATGELKVEQAVEILS